MWCVHNYSKRRKKIVLATTPQQLFWDRTRLRSFFTTLQRRTSPSSVTMKRRLAQPKCAKPNGVKHAPGGQKKPCLRRFLSERVLVLGLGLGPRESSHNMFSTRPLTRFSLILIRSRLQARSARSLTTASTAAAISVTCAAHAIFTRCHARLASSRLPVGTGKSRCRTRRCGKHCPAARATCPPPNAITASTCAWR